MNDIVVNKIQGIQRCIRRARKVYQANPDGFATNTTHQDAALLNVLRACEMTIDLANQLGASAILRGIRSSVDLYGELQMAEANRTAGGVETVFIATSASFALISSSLIRQIARGGGDVSAMVPAQALPFISDAAQGA